MSGRVLSGDVALDECRLVARYGRCRHEFERKNTGPGKSAKWIGLRLPIQIAECRGKSKRLVLGCARGKRGPSLRRVQWFERFEPVFEREPVERTGQGFRNLLGSLVLDLPALEHEYDFPVLQQWRWKGKRADNRRSNLWRARWLRYRLRQKRLRHGRGASDAGAPTQHRVALLPAAQPHTEFTTIMSVSRGFPCGGIDFSGSPQLFDTQLGQFNRIGSTKCSG